MADDHKELKIDIDNKKLGVVYTSTDIKNILPDDHKEDVDELITIMNEFNGAFDSAQAGVGAAYIPHSAYFHVVVVGEGAEMKISTDPRNEIVELFYNWKALGRGKGGIFGAAIRYACRHLVDLKRETIPHAECKIAVGDKEDFKLFREQLSTHKLNAAIWAKQFPSILAMNGACLIAISHHWDSENSKPWDAIVSSLGQQEVIENGLYKYMFYLALHPIPLPIVEHYRAEAAEGKSTTYLNAVSVRARCTPATTGPLMVAAAAINDFKAEPFFTDVKGPLLHSILELATLAGQIKGNPASYCPLATTMGKVRTVVDLTAHKLPMIILTAYIYESVKGSLAKSQSLRKFANANSRVINRWRQLFATVAEAELGNLRQEFAKYADEPNVVGGD